MIYRLVEINPEGFKVGLHAGLFKENQTGGTPICVFHRVAHEWVATNPTQLLKFPKEQYLKIRETLDNLRESDNVPDTIIDIPPT